MQVSFNNSHGHSQSQSDATSPRLSDGRENEETESMNRSRRKLSSSSPERRVPPEQDPKYDTAPFTETPGLTSVEYRSIKASHEAAPREYTKFARELEPVSERNTEQSQIVGVKSHADLEWEGQGRATNEFSHYRHPQNAYGNKSFERHGQIKYSQHMESTGRTDTENDQFAHLGANFRSPQFQKDEFRETKESGFRDTRESGFVVRTEPNEHDQLEPKNLNSSLIILPKKKNPQENFSQSKLGEYTFQAGALRKNLYETGHSNKYSSVKPLSRSSSLAEETVRQNDGRRGSNNQNSFSYKAADSSPQDSYHYVSKSLDNSFQYRKSPKAQSEATHNTHSQEPNAERTRLNDIYAHEAIQRILKSNDPIVLKCFIKKLLDSRGQSENVDPLRPALGELQRSGNIVSNNLNRSKPDLETSAYHNEAAYFKQAVAQLEEENRVLRKERKEAVKKAAMFENGNKDKIRVLQLLTQENSQLQKKLVDQATESEQSIKNLLQEVKRLELSNQNLLNDHKQQIEKFQAVMRRNNIEKTQEQSQNQEMKRSIEESAIALKTLTLENESLKTNNNRLKSIVAGHEKLAQSRKPDPESANISVLEFRNNDLDHSAILDDNSRNILREDHYKTKTKELKERVHQLESEIINLRLELKTRPSFHLQQKGNELKVKQSKKEAERQRSQSIDFGIFGGDAFVNKSLADIRLELGVGSSDQIIPRIRELYSEIKMLVKFTDAIKDMAVKCAPSGFYNIAPNLKQIWRFLKGIVQEHINIKKQIVIDRFIWDLLNELKGLLGLKEATEIGPKVSSLTQENIRMYSIISKFKFLNDFKSESLYDVDRALDIQLCHKAGERNFYRCS